MTYGGKRSTMVIQRIETVRTAEFPNIIHVRIHTEGGIVGLGETSFGAAAVEAYIHESAAQCLLGRNPLDIERHWTALHGFVGFNSTGAEMRGRSAIDIALWDILGKVCGQPVHVVLGGASRDRLRVYNTCAGYRYVRAAGPGGRLPVSNWGVESDEGPYEDLDGFLHRPVQLARSLLDQGITAMKIWPFDPYAEASDGHGISDADLNAGCEPLRRIRDVVGGDMEIMLELHSMWDVPTAARIADAVAELQPSWIEDPIRMDSVAALQQLAAQTSIPIVASETLGTRWSYQALIESGAVSVVMIDPVWAGGLTEARKIAAMADTAHLPVTPHDCLGPVQFTAAWHLAMHAPNTLILESVRAFYAGWYRELVTYVPEVRDGFVGLPTAPGLGTELLPSVLQRPDAIVRVSDLGSPA